jgi:MFS family permease
MAASNMALFGGAFFTPVVVGKITDTMGWRWTFNFIAIFAGVLFPFIFFFVPETAFPRIQNSNSMHIDNHELIDRGSNESKEAYGGEARPIPQKVSFAQSLMPFNGRKTNENFLKLVLRPFPLFLHPAILWACLIQGAMIGWTVMLGVVLAVIFIGPPLFFTELTTGYMYTGPFIGAFIGFFIAGAFTDVLTKWMIKKNNGIYEPEFRITLVIPQMITGAIGLYGFGWAAANVTPGGYVIPDIFFALEVVGMVIGAVASALYISDAYGML